LLHGNYSVSLKIYVFSFGHVLTEGVNIIQYLCLGMKNGITSVNYQNHKCL
jgi:hypothetical protein